MSGDLFLERLQRLDTCALSDALDRLGLAGAVSGLSPRTGGGYICGRVITVKLEPGTASGDAVKHLGATAIESASPGDVIVVEQSSGIEAAGWGGILSNAAQQCGVAGVIVEGPARDIDEAAKIGFPVFARAATTRTARGRVREAATGAPIKVGDVEVRQGDYVAIDSSGAVFIAHTHMEAVLEAAETIAAREAAMTGRILKGELVGSVMNANYERMLEK